MALISSDFKADFISGYLEAALWTSEPDSLDECEGDKDLYFIDNIAADSMDKIRNECEEFILRTETVLAFVNYNIPETSNGAMAGHDFWLTRNGHGSGFWDRGLGNTGIILDSACTQFKSSDCYVGDDKQLHFT